MNFSSVDYKCVHVQSMFILPNTMHGLVLGKGSQLVVLTKYAYVLTWVSFHIL